MSSPIHHPEDLDAALVYAPPWAREPTTPPARRRSASARMPRSPAAPEFSGDRAMIELQRQLAVDRDDVPPPPPPQALEAARLWPMVLRFGAVTGMAALVAWGVVALTGPRQAASETVQTEIPPPRPTANTVKLVHYQVPAMAPSLLPDRLAETSPSPAPTAPAPSPMPALTVPPMSTPAAPPSGGLTLADDEIATLVKRGQTLFQSGDLAAARLLLQRAAEAGNASAAVSLGATFDPLVIRRLGVIGIKPDAERAREWYRKAAQLGSTEAAQQLAKLEQAR